MRTTTLTRAIGNGIGAALFVTGLLALTPHTDAAQDQPQVQQQGRPGSRGPGGRGGRMGGEMGRPMNGGLDAVMRDLTAEQREQVKAIRQRHAGQIEPLMERVRTARQALNEAALTGNTGALQGLSIDIGNAETDLALAQAQVHAEIAGILTAEQKQRLVDRNAQMMQRRQEMMRRRQAR
jgi:Spy/CpxP family protein refolding chaperone